MARNISTKFIVEGDSEYKNAIKGINSELSTVKSEMALVTSEYKKQQGSSEALKAKIEVLNKQYDLQAQKVTAMREAQNNAAKAQDDFAKKSEELRAKISKAEVEYKKLGGATGDVSEEQKKLSEEIAKGKAELEKNISAEEKAAKATLEWEKSANYAKASLNKLGDEISENNTQLQTVQSGMKNAADATKKFGNEAKESGDKAKGMGDNASTGINALASVLVASGVQQGLNEIKENLNECYVASKEFGKGMAEVYTLLPGISDQAKGKLSEDLLSLKSDFGIVGTQGTDALYQAVSAGVKLGDTMSFMTTAQKAAVGGVTGLETAVKGLTSVTNAYGTENLNSTQAADLMFTAVRLGKTNFEELSASLYNVVPVASNNKLAFEDITAAIAAMTAQGVPTAQSTTQIRQMLLELTDAGSGVAKAFEEVSGTSFTNFIAKGGNTQEALELLNKKASNAGVGINQLFSGVEAGGAAIALAGKNAKRYATNIDEMKKSAGACDKAFSEMSETSDYAEKKFQAGAEGIMIAIGSVLEPALKDLHNSGADAFAWATEFVENNPWVVSSIVAVGVALKVLTAIIGGVLLVTQVLKPALKAFYMALAGHPIGLVLIAITALVAGIAALAATWPETTNAATEAADAAEKSAQRLGEVAKKTEESSTAIKANAAACMVLIGRLEKLEEQGLSTKESQQEYADVVEQLKSKMPGLNWEIDENTKKLKVNRDTTAKNIELEEKKAKAAVYSEKLTIALEEQARAEFDLQAAKNKQIKAAKTMQENAEKEIELQEKINEIKSKENQSEYDLENIAAYYEELEQLAISSQEAKTSIEEQAGAIEANQGAFDTASGAVSEAKGAYNELNTALAEANTELEEQNAKHGDAVSNLESAAAQITSLETALATAKDGISSNLDSLFGKFNMVELGTSVTVDGMIESYESHSKYMDEYSANLAAVMDDTGVKIDEALRVKLSDGTKESAEALAVLAVASDEKMTEFNKAFRKSEEGKDTFIETTAKMGLDFDGKMNGIKTKIDETVAHADKSVETADAAGRTVDAIVVTLQNRTAEVQNAFAALMQGGVNATKKALEINSPSKVYMRLTDATTDGIVLSIANNKASVNAAYANLAKTNREAYYRSLGLYTASSVFNSSEDWANQTIKLITEKSKKKVDEEINKLSSDDKKSSESTKIKALADEAQKVGKEMQDQLNTLRKSHQKNIEDIRKNNKKNLADIKKDYTSTLDDINRDINSRKDALGNPSEMFSGMKDAKYFIENMRNQSKELASFQKELEKLGGKKLPKEFVEQIEQLGPESLADLQVLNGMTKAQLAEYIKLWEQRQKTAGNIAEKQYKDEKAAAKKKRDEEIKEENKRFEDQLKKENSRAEKELNKLKAKTEKAMDMISKSISNGLKKGLLNSGSGVVKAMEKMIEDMVKAAKKELKINSPSGVGIEISENFSESLVIGQENKKGKVIKSSADMAAGQAESYKEELEKNLDSYYRAVQRMRRIQNNLYNSNQTTNNNTNSYNVTNTFTGGEKISPAILARKQRQQLQELVRRVRR